MLIFNNRSEVFKNFAEGLNDFNRTSLFLIRDPKPLKGAEGGTSFSRTRHFEPTLPRTFAFR